MLDRETKERFRNYKIFSRSGYNLDVRFDKDFLNELVNRISDVYLKIEDADFQYERKTMTPQEIFKLVEDFFYMLYDDKKIITKVNELLDKAYFIKIDDYMDAKASVIRDFNLKKPKINYFKISYLEDILTSSLITHELGHALYLPAIELIYDEVISMTFERLFGDLNYSELNTHYARCAIESVYTESYEDIFFKRRREEILRSETFFAQTYLVGFVASLYLVPLYKEDTKKFRELLKIDDYKTGKNILDYYGIKIDSYKSMELVDEEVIKVLKKTSNN